MEKMMCDPYENRADLRFPCKECADRYPGCREDCKKPEFLRVKELREKLNKEKRSESEMLGYLRRKSWKLMVK